MDRRIFTYWDQGFDNAPEIVRACVSSFYQKNSGWSIVLLDSETIADWIEPIPIPADKWNRLSLPHRSDLIRTQLLIRHGGVWADPTVWFCKPLDDWLPKAMRAGVFMFHRPGRDRAISNWFIAAHQNNQLLQRQYDRLCTYWRENEFDNLGGNENKWGQFLKRAINRNLEWPRLWLWKPIIRLFRTCPYMIYHYLIYDLVRSEPEFGRMWQSMPKISAHLPIFLLHRGLFEPLDENTRKFIDAGSAPLYKLTWKLPSGSVPPGSILDYLYSTRSVQSRDPGVRERCRDN